MAAKTFIKGENWNHVDGKKASRVGASRTDVLLDGEGNRKLFEPVPQYFFRKGDSWLPGENNTLIVFGRDRAAAGRDAEAHEEVFTNNSLKTDDRSGYSNQMGAGAIDIVVGRGAPFPLKEIKHDDPIVLGPLFNTIRPSSLNGYSLTNGKLHPGMAMDAARIYISQMTDIDENFDIRKPLVAVAAMDEDNREFAYLESAGRTPTSGIMLKADKIRMHGRQNIKLVTRGPAETVNSQGNNIVKSNIGIHLIANNGFHITSGAEAVQHPIPLGANIEAAFHAMLALIEESVRITSNFAEIQDRFNMKVSNHFHWSPPGLAIADPFSSIQGIITGLEILTKAKFQATFHDINIANFKTRFLTEANEEDYINSKYNTVN
jgi:hypothetical protein